MPLYRRVEQPAPLGEYICVEFAEELIYGHLRPRIDLEGSTLQEDEISSGT
jgi:hypothetical protein